MVKQYSIAEARNSLPSLVREAESGKAVELTRRGEPVAVLIGRRQYEQLTSKYRRFSVSYRDFKQEFALEELGIEPDELFGASRAESRDESDGREIDL